MSSSQQQIKQLIDEWKLEEAFIQMDSLAQSIDNQRDYSTDNDNFDEQFWFQEAFRSNYEADSDNPPLDGYLSTGSAIDGTRSPCEAPDNGFFDESASFNGAVRASNDWTRDWVVW